MIQYYKLKHPNGTVRYFALADTAPGVPLSTEWRLSWPEKHVWVELPTRPVFGRLIRGDTSLDPVDPDDVPVLLSADTIELAAA